MSTSAVVMAGHDAVAISPAPTPRSQPAETASPSRRSNENWARRGRSPSIRRAGRPRRCIPLLWRAQEQAAAGCRRRRSRRSPTGSACRTSASSRSRPSTRCSTSSRSGATSSSSAARRPARCAARTSSRRCCSSGSASERHVTADGNVLLARGRVPRRLLQRADGADQRRLLRGPDARELRAAARRPRRRAAGEARPADRPRRSEPRAG